MAGPLLEITGVSIGFADPQGRVQAVLKEFSLELAQGETVALWGPSGSGKTTLLNLVAGLLVPDCGSIVLSPATGAERAIVAGAHSSPVVVTGLTQEQLLEYRRTRVGYVFQHFNLIETLTVEENVQLARELAGLENADGLVSASLQTLGLTALANRFPAELSGGEQQRVAVLRALAHNPPLVLADEPTGNLDRDNSDRVADLLWAQVNAQGAALLIATHSDSVAQRADRVIEFGQTT